MTGKREFGPALLILGALAAASLIAIDAGTPLRFVAGGALVFALPGRALVGAVLAETPDVWTRIALSVGASIALTALGAVVMNAAGLDLDQTAITAWLVAITIVAAVASLARARGTGLHAPMLNVWQFSAAAIVAAAFIGAVAIARRTPHTTAVPGYTTLSAHRSGTAVTIVVTSSETSPTPTHYRVTMSNADQSLGEQTFALATGHRWIGNIPAQTGASAVDVALFRAGTAAAYRRLVLAPTTS